MLMPPPTTTNTLTFFTLRSVGFDIRGDIKIFDFGLAKELVGMEPDEEGLYKMTGMSK